VHSQRLPLSMLDLLSQKTTLSFETHQTFTNIENKFANFVNLSKTKHVSNKKTFCFFAEYVTLSTVFKYVECLKNLFQVRNHVNFYMIISYILCCYSMNFLPSVGSLTWTHKFVDNINWIVIDNFSTSFIFWNTPQKVTKIFFT